jgi:6-pyruvoyltetrahydropterin/6-carboxytetrahydropterin synthase
MGMFTLCVKDSFAAAHRLIGYEGKCEDLHGHNFVVEAFFSGEKLGDDGLLVDFKILKDYLKDVLDNLDHKYLNEIPFFVERASSAEESGRPQRNTGLGIRQGIRGIWTIR